MMTKQTSGKTILLKKITVLPLLCVLALLFAEETKAQKKKNNTTKKQEAVFYITNEKGTTYYNSSGQQVDKDGKILDPAISKVYKDGKVVVITKKGENDKSPIVKKGDITNIPPPPKGAAIDLKKLGDKNPDYFLDGKKISKQEFEKLDTNKIATINVVKEGSTHGAIYIVTKK